MFYDNFVAACCNKGTTLTGLLKKLGKSTGSTGTWRDGKYPKLDTVMEMAEYLDISLDELVYGKSRSCKLDESTQEWIDIISNIPEDRQQICKDFLRTHMAATEKQAKRKKG